MRKMVRYLIILFISFLPTGIYAQSSLNYTILNSTNGTTATDSYGNPLNIVGATNLVPNSATNAVSALQSIGFDFIFMGKFYSHFMVGTNGQLGFGISNSPVGMLSGSGVNDLTRTVLYPPTGSDNAPVLAAFWDKMTTPSSNRTVRSVLTGTTPNRCRTIEWNTIINSTIPNPTNSARFQMRFYEGTGIIEYVYANMSIVSSSVNVTASIGFTAGSSDNQFLALQDMTSFPFTAIGAQEPATQNLVNTSVPGDIPGLNSSADGQRRILKFTPPTLTGSPLSGLQVTQIGATNVALSWNDTYSNELGYAILVSPDNINFFPAGFVPANINYFTVSNLTLGNTYFFKVIAFTEGASFASNTVSAVTSCYFNGTYTIGPGGHYTSLAKAVDSIKIKGVTGNVFFEIMNNYSSVGEVFPISFPKTAQIPCMGSFKITVRPAASATNIRITGASNGPLIFLDSTNYVRIDGRPGGNGTISQLEIVNMNNAPSIRFLDASENKLSYLKLGGGIAGISSLEGVVNFQSSRTPGSDNNKLEFCDLFSADTALASKGILLYSSGVNGFDNNNDSIINCNFRNYSTSAISLNSFNVGWIIQGNSFYNTTTINFSNAVSVIKIDPHSSTTIDHQLTQNHFGGMMPNGQGSVMQIGYNQSYSCMEISGKSVISNNYFSRMRFFNASATNNAQIRMINIGNNSAGSIITDNQFGSSNLADSLHFYQGSGDTTTTIACILAGSPFGPAPIRNNHFTHIRCYGGVGRINLQGIEILLGGANINDNFIGNPSIPNSIINYSNGGTYGIRCYGGGKVKNNTISSISAYGNHDNAFLIGISVNSGSLDSIYNNTISNLRNSNSPPNNLQCLVGMTIYPTSPGGFANLVEGNHVHSLVNDCPSGGGNVTGIQIGNAILVRKNFVHNLYSTNTSTVSYVYGILIPDNWSELENNMVSLGFDSLGNSITAGNVFFAGISGGSVMKHNSVYLGGNNVTDHFMGSACFLFLGNALPTVNVNNIYFNARSNANANSVGKHQCINTHLSYTSDYNLYYFTGTGGIMGSFGNFRYNTLSDWRSATGLDLNSIFNNPQFIAPATNSNLMNLHVTNASPADASGSGSYTLTTDIDNQIRTGLTPIDMGADAISAAFPVPTITSFTPTSGGTGTIITITGTNFTGATAVSFGGTAATSYTVVNTTTITAVVSIGTSGSVSVTTPGGTATLAGFTFVSSPTITSFIQSSGGTGATITINGTNFIGATAVSFGGIAASSFSVVNPTTITAIIGNGASGNISVTTPGGTATKTGFTFISPPSIISFTPGSGTTSATITITGSNFTGTTAVSFGGVAASSFIVVNATTITAVVANGASGAISITTPGGTATSSTAFTYAILREGIIIKPNPANDIITVTHPVSITGSFLKLIDLNGRIVKLTSIVQNSGLTTMSVKGTPTGIYKLIWTDGITTLQRTLMITQ